MNRKAAAYTLLVWTAIAGIVYGFMQITFDQFFNVAKWVFGGLLLIGLVIHTYDFFDVEA